MFLRYFYIVFLCISANSFAQDIELFGQFNGRYDYTAIGNTLNPYENNLVQSFCYTLPSSSAVLNIENPDAIIAAYIYWAGSGNGDTNIALNGISIDAQWIYNTTYEDTSFGTLTYFSCVADITDSIISEGNSTYTFSELDISEALQNNPGYCSNRTNFAGWALYVIYEDDSLPLNQISLFNGMEIINRNVPQKTIILDNLNVIDNDNAKIGFLAWEGDNALNYGETLSINGNILSNPPLNPANNAFNGTNTFTNSNTFFNGDLDVYDIQNNIQIGDTSAAIQLTTGDFDANGIFQADLIIINNIITVLNSQLPDATIILDDYELNCERELTLFYTVYNTNSTAALPANVPIAFYADTILIAQSHTQNSINIGDYESGTITITLPGFVTTDFLLSLIVDDDGLGNSTIAETNENNNMFDELVGLLTIPPIQVIENLLLCDVGFDTATFNLPNHFFSIINTNENATFYTGLSDLETGINAIFMPHAYNNTSSPQTIYVKVTAEPCYDIYEFDVAVENCPPYIPQGFSPNDDGYNDWFNIQGLYDIFENHKLLIYNRYGTLIFEGNNDTPWNGKANRGLNNLGKILPNGTYYYVLHLNDPNYKSMVGWVYLNR